MTNGSSSVLFAVGVGLLLICGYFYQRRVMFTHPVTEIDDVTVVNQLDTQRLDAWRYEFIDTHGNHFVQDICKDYIQPEFEQGLVIKRLIYVDLDDLGEGCWSLDPEKHAGYFKLRDKHGNPVFRSTGRAETETR